MSKKNHRQAIVAEYESSLCRLMLAAVTEFPDIASGGVPERGLINFLRGNQDPPEESDPENSCHGALHDHSAVWLAVVLDRLAEEGYLERPGDGGARYSVSRNGERLRSGRDQLVHSVLPQPARLGEDPAVETRLRELRRKICDAEGRPAFSIFDNRALAWLAHHKPKNLGELVGAPGFGTRRIEKYGRRIVSLIRRTT